MQLAFVWDAAGPYHYARIDAVDAVAGHCGTVWQFADGNRTYAWTTDRPDLGGLRTLLSGRVAEDISFLPAYLSVRTALSREHPDVLFCPSYWPSRSLGAVMAASVARVPCVMMNESHGGTAQGSRIKRWLKQPFLRLFDAALVGGGPHRRHFISLGMKPDSIFSGYDAVDNDYFREAADIARHSASDVREKHGLPRRYILNVGRMVAKKNLGGLIGAYAQAVSETSDAPALVLVGSGSEETALMQQARESKLSVIDARQNRPAQRPLSGAAVYFYGFRQIDETPAFFALADCFVLPSLQEEWGLVVNEAMACGLPVLVSRTAGCAEDLVEEDGNGFRFDPTAPDELAKLLRKLNENSTLRNRLGGRSREIISRWGCDNFARQALRAAKFAIQGRDRSGRKSI